VRIPQRALSRGQIRSVPQEEMSACSGIPGPGKAEPSLQRMSTFKPPAGSLFATEGGLQMAPVGQPGGFGTPGTSVVSRMKNSERSLVPDKKADLGQELTEDQL